MNKFILNRTEPEQTPTPTPTPTPIPTLNADTEVKADTGILESDNNKDLCLKLIHAETEEEVKFILRQYGYWGDSDEYWGKTNDWEYFGGNENAWATAGNQASSPDYALVEKLTNSIDHVLLRECKRRNITPTGTKQDGTPQTMQEAVEKFFNVPKGKISECLTNERIRLSENIKLIATGSNSNPCYIIADKGEGQPPEELPNTLLSYGKSNKLKVPFVQGKFNMGGLAIFRFCNFQLILSKQDPSLSDKSEDKNLWGVTIIHRKRSSSDIERSSSIRYLAPKGNILSFAEDDLPIFPGKHLEPYTNPMKFGTFIKLYEYDLSGYKSYKTQIKFNFYYRLSLLLEGTCLPIRLYETRDNYRGAGQEQTLAGLQIRLQSSKDGEVHNRLECEPISINFPPILGQKIKGKCYVFKEIENPNNKHNYAKNEGVVFSINGQSHGDLPERFFERKGIGLGALAKSKSLLVVLDCTSISNNQKENLFMNSRDRIDKSSEIAREIQEQLKDWLKKHPGLRRMNVERIAEQNDDKLADDKPLRDILEKVLKRSPVLSKLFLEGQRLPSPMPPEEPLSPPILKDFPEKFDLIKNYSHEKARKYSKDTLIIFYETDAENDYFERVTDAGEITLYVNDQPYDDFSMNLWQGKGALKIYADSDWKLGQVIEVRSEVTDITRARPFVSTFFIERIEPPENKPGNPPKTKGGFDIPIAQRIKENQYNDPKYKRFNFNKNSALKIEENNEKHDYYVNVDNIHLETEQKYSKSNSAVDLENLYVYAMVLIGLALLQENKEKQENEKNENYDIHDDENNPLDDIAETAEKLSMVLLPMINGLADLSKEQDEE